MSLIQMSVSGAVMILVIVVIRALLLHKLPKRAFTVLWGVVLVRLLIPYTLPCPFSAYSLLSGISPAEISAPADNVTVPPVTDFTTSDPVTPFVPDLSTGNVTVPAPEVPIENGLPFDIKTAVLLAGMAVCAVFFTVSYIRCRLRFRESLPVESSYIAQWLSEHRLRRRISVRQSDRISAPLTYGVFCPVILLPKNYEKIDEDDLKFVLSHEYVHIRRFDTVFKILLTAALCVHWFNPLVWAMYLIANKDIEISCDEAVITMLGETEKKRYAMTLIRMEEIKSGLAPLISHYSKNHIKERIVTIMKFKKTTTLAAAAAVFLAVGVTTAFATSAKSPDNASASTSDSAKNVAASSNDPSNEDIAKDVIDLDIGEYDPSLVSEGNRRYEEQKAKYGQLLPNDYANIPRESTYGIMTDIDTLMVSHMKYVNEDDGKPDIYTDSNGGKVVTLDYLDMQNAEIVFEDGSAASKDNILPGTSVLVQYVDKDDLFPGVIHCTKIVIMKDAAPQAPAKTVKTTTAKKYTAQY